MVKIQTTELNNQEKQCANTAFKLVEEAGGFVTFDEYDRLAKDKFFNAPIEWCQGWGSAVLLRSNQEKLSAFAAVKLGLLTQENGGYKCQNQ